VKTIKWGIIGAGRIAATFATALKAIDDVTLVAIASRDLERAKEFAERFHIEKAYGNYKELVEDFEIDVIYIATPHSEHKANAILCITNGKAVLCEKPFTVNRQEAQFLIDLAKEHNVFLMEAMWTKFLPVTQVVKNWIKDERIGEVNHVNINMSYKAKFDINSRLFNPDTAGGALLDIGVYPITYVIHLLNKLPDQVVSSAIIGESHVDEQNAIIFRYTEDILATLNLSISAEIGNEAIIIGDKGKIVIPTFWKAESAELFDEDGNLFETISIPFKCNGYEFEAEEVNRCLREGRKESEENPLSDTLNIIKVMDDIRADWGLKYPQEGI